jgi:hypothetical protein
MSRLLKTKTKHLLWFLPRLTSQAHSPSPLRPSRTRRPRLGGRILRLRCRRSRRVCVCGLQVGRGGEVGMVEEIAAWVVGSLGRRGGGEVGYQTGWVRRSTWGSLKG